MGSLISCEQVVPDLEVIKTAGLDKETQSWLKSADKLFYTWHCCECVPPCARGSPSASLPPSLPPIPPLSHALCDCVCVCVCVGFRARACVSCVSYPAPQTAARWTLTSQPPPHLLRRTPPYSLCGAVYIHSLHTYSTYTCCIYVRSRYRSMPLVCSMRSTYLIYIHAYSTVKCGICIVSTDSHMALQSLHPVNA